MDKNIVLESNNFSANTRRLTLLQEKGLIRYENERIVLLGLENPKTAL